MTQPKYISKQVIQFNDQVQISKYFYNWGVAVYITDKRREGSLLVNVHYYEIDKALASTKKSG